MADEFNEAAYLANYEPSSFVQESSTGKPITAGRDRITLKLDNDDIAFVLGKHGVTKQKLAKVADTRLEVDEKAYTLTIVGPEDKRRRAHEYIDMVLAQRKGVVQVDLTMPRDDLTILSVPADCVGYVTGASGKVLRGLEMEWGTLMFFLNPSRDANGQETETLVIFGQVRGRLGAALKVMSAVEHKRKEGYYVKNGVFTYDFSKELDPDPTGFYLEQQLLHDADFSYALGREGKTRKKLARASGAILEYVGLVAIMIGTNEERTRVKDYLRWLLQQRAGQCDVEIVDRSDVSTINVEAKYVGWVTGVQGKNFRHIEEETGVYLFTNRSSGAKLEGDQVEQILIFSFDPRARERAERSIKRSIEEKKDADLHGSRLSRRGGERGERGDRRDRRRSRSPPRRRGASPRRGRSESPPRRRRDDSPRRRDDSPRGRRRDDDRMGGRGRGRSRDRR